MLVGAPKCPSSIDVDATEFDNYVANLVEFLLNNKKIPKKWWSFEVAKLLLQLHLKSVKEFGSGVQGASFLENKKQVTKSKFEMDQKNWETKLARKRALEEEEQKEAATNCKEVAQQSKRIADCLERMSAPSTQDVSRVIEERLEAHQAQVTESVQHMLGAF
jgi:predicted HTH transcriptional regulator